MQDDQQKDADYSANGEQARCERVAATAARRLRSIRDFVRYGVTSFNRAQLCFGHGFDNALDEAAFLVAHALSLSPRIEDAFIDCAVTDEEARAILTLFDERVATRKPAAYLVGETWYSGLRLRCDERALVPRSPIGQLVEESFEPWIASDPRAVLDLCTGGGALALAIAAWFPGCAVSAADLSEDALSLAQENAVALDLDDRIEWIRSDLFEALGGRRFDLIVSNPPYVGEQEYRSLAAEFSAEPRIGLVSGSDGFDIPLAILANAAEHLTEQGVLIMEVGHGWLEFDALVSDADWIWLDFEHGGEGVLAISREALQTLSPAIQGLISARCKRAREAIDVG